MVPPTSAAGARAGLVFTGTAMEVPSDGAAPPYVAGLTLRLTADGLAVEGPGDAPGRTVPWDRIEGGRCGEPGFLSGGEPAVALSAIVAGTYVRWLVPYEQLPPERALAVDALLRARSAIAPDTHPSGTPPYWAPEPLRTNGRHNGAATGTGAGRRGGGPGPGRGPGPGPSDEAATVDGGEVAPVAPVAPVGGEPAGGVPAAGDPLADDRPAPGSALQPDGAPLVAPVFRSPPGLIGRPWLPSGAAPAVSSFSDGGAVATSSGVAPATVPAVIPDGPAAPARRADDPWRRPSRRKVIAALWTLAVLLGALAVLLAVAGSEGKGAPAVTRAVEPGHSADRLLAVDLNVGKADFPSDWTVDTSATGPLTGFLSAGVGVGGGVLAAEGATTAAERAEETQVETQFSSCLGIRPTDDRVFGTASGSPLARGSSPAFAGPTSGPPTEAGSLTAVYRTAGAVRSAMAQVRTDRFATCFARAITRQVQSASTGTGSGTTTTPTPGGAAGAPTTYGTPSVNSMSLPQTSAVRALGVDLDFPVTVGGATTSVQLGFAFVGGGRVESTILTFATAAGFPTTLMSRLVQSVEHRMAATHRVTGA